LFVDPKLLNKNVVSFFSVKLTEQNYHSSMLMSKNFKILSIRDQEAKILASFHIRDLAMSRLRPATVMARDKYLESWEMRTQIKEAPSSIKLTGSKNGSLGNAVRKITEELLNFIVFPPNRVYTRIFSVNPEMQIPTTYIPTTKINSQS
jgi:hypothetical protein